jgi:hypothetical protein
MICNSVGAVWIHPDVDILVENFTLNTITSQNFTYVEIGDTYTNLSWDGTVYHNITFVSNVNSSESVIQRSTGTSLNQVTNLSFDLYAPSNYSVSVLLKVLTATGVTDASVVPTCYHSNATHRQYHYDYNPSNTIPDAGLGLFDVNISATVTNATLTYTGYNLTEDLFRVLLVEPPYNGTSFYNTTLNGVNLTWQNGNNSEYTIVVQNNNSYPASHSDGWVRSNSTSFTTFNDSSVLSTRYYTVFNYNTTYNVYSTGLNIPWGALGLSCFNESSGLAIGFDIEISNSDGSDTYIASDLSNIHYIDLNDIPYGDDTIFFVTNSSYKLSSYTKDLTLNNFLNYSFFLAPIWTSQDDNETTPEEETLMAHSDTAAVTDPTVDVEVNLDHTPEEITAVYVYNTSISGWVPIAEDHYSYDSGTNNVTINASVLDINSSLVRVDYTSYESRGSTETEVYLLAVIDTIGARLSGAKIIILRYIDTTGQYEEVRSSLTDGNGEATFYLIPDIHYKVNVSKDGYTTAISDYIPTLAVRTKTFRLSLEEVDTDRTNWLHYIDMSATMSELGILSISYTDSLSNTTSVNVTVYLWDGSTYSAVYYYNSSSSFTTSTTVNTTYGYKVVFNVSHGDFDDFSHTIMINRHFSTSVDDLNDMFAYILGSNPFGWVNFIAIFIMLACMLTFGEAGAGISLLGTGFVFLFLNILIVGFIASTTIPILFIVLGMLVEWKHARKG